MVKDPKCFQPAPTLTTLLLVLGDIPATYAKGTLAEQELGWKAEKTLDQMCKHHLLVLWKVFLLVSLALGKGESIEWQPCCLAKPRVSYFSLYAHKLGLSKLCCTSI